MHSLAGAGTGITGRVAEGQFTPPWHGLEPILRMLKRQRSPQLQGDYKTGLTGRQ